MNIKVDYFKLVTLLMSTLQAVESAAEDKVITVREFIQVLEKLAGVMGILDKPILKLPGGEEK